MEKWLKLPLATKVLLASQGIALVYAFRRKAYVPATVAALALTGIWLSERLLTPSSPATLAVVK
jgi:hypothetical protein